MWTEPLEFGKLTWPEVARAVGKGRVPIVPIGTLEDHGYHLPIDTDVTLVEAVCRGAAERLPAETVLLPPIVHGYSPHHMDFPGTVSIRWDTFCRYCTDVALSLVRHGFRRVLMVNGHGSNQNLVETAARVSKTRISTVRTLPWKGPAPRPRPRARRPEPRIRRTIRSSLNLPQPPEDPRQLLVDGGAHEHPNTANLRAYGAEGGRGQDPDFWENVAVGVEGDRYSGVAEEFLSDIG